MGDSHSGMTEGTELTLLPRDPEEGYVFWECPALEGAGASGEVQISIQGEDLRWEVVHRQEIRGASGGVFVAFHRPGLPHRARLEWPGGALESAIVEAPRRSPGANEPRFVRVGLSPTGLEREPTEHHHPTRGRFRAAARRAGSSSTARR